VLRISNTDILEVCCKIEETCSNLYRFFSKLYADNPQVRALWEKTAIEEDNHAEHFRLACRLKGSGMKSLKTDMYMVTNTLTKMQSVYEGVQNSPPPLKEALRFAIKLEHSLADYHMHALATFDDENLAHLFESMLKNDQGHIQMLENAYEDLIEC
jgi:rubrerythrin